MRPIASTFIALALSGALLRAAAQEVKPDRAAHPIARHLADLNAVARQSEATMQGNVRFVFGNDLWQPRQQFKTGDDWLALACDAKGCVLEPATLKVTPEFWQGHYDDKPTFGQRLSFTRNRGFGYPVVAWFHITAAPPWLRTGTVQTYYAPHHPLKQPTGRGTLEVLIDLPSGQTAMFVPMLLTKETMQQLMPEGHGYGSAFYLQLRAQGKRQLLLGSLGDCSGTFHPRSYLQWAGDLDRDGSADFLVSFVDADGPVHLYLSSAAKAGQLVGLAGVYMSPPFGGECDGGGEWK